MDKKKAQTGERGQAPRRVVLLAAGQVGVMFAVGGLLKLERGRAQFIRPPGTLSEADLLARCIKCRRCVEVCPQDVLRGVRLAESIAAFDTPCLDFDLGACDFCLECVEVCPTDALHAAPADGMTLGVAVVDRDACVAWTWGGCTRCYNQCPYGAIHLDAQQRPVVDAAACTGCGVCEHVCDRSAKRWQPSQSGKGITVQPLDETR
ncbi:MAG TPA: 4Fe-4S dicluster domain-containing protein [Aggregatilineales bacterium]|nr:4Fe-4S dicluster domain-containing protein [Aggregatilineales bacterium]HPV06755.1 4Fe-4S dicluster domain-containing protein [Aggregatilineales bacterium]HQA67631.1 4Fe-4S dicluster domain-containing protein [Aggregatilineales bacterium]HQE17882.1 4Fe-4S dicluster domain-containing protein [Aggregatilineales bacterium]